MISDVLFEAITEIDRYLSSETFSRCYVGVQREALAELRDRMEIVRGLLDTPPMSESQRRVWEESPAADIEKLCLGFLETQGFKVTKPQDETAP